jgi:hypothetical protein
MYNDLVNTLGGLLSITIATLMLAYSCVALGRIWHYSNRQLQELGRIRGLLEPRLYEVKTDALPIERELEPRLYEIERELEPRLYETPIEREREAVEPHFTMPH